MKNVTKQRFTLVQLGNRGGGFYCKDTQTKLRKSLETKNRAEAERLIVHKNEAAVASPNISRKIGLVYLADSDPEMGKRTWRMVMDDIIKDKHGPTLVRYLTALKDPAYKLIEGKLLVETLPADFMEVLRAGTTSTNVYLRRFQNHAVDMDWLTKRVLPKKKFPKLVYGEQRAITRDENSRIIERERNPERRDFYELCWHTGGSQSDVACLDNDDIDRIRRCFVYERFKNSELGGMQLGPEAWSVIERRPKTGPLFPYLRTVREADCASEFKQRCEGLGIFGVTLHSYRYAWAERSVDAGYPNSGLNSHLKDLYMSSCVVLEPIYSIFMRSAMHDVLPAGVRRSLSKFGHDLAVARRKRQLTVGMMAERTGLAKSTYSRIEKGDAAVGLGAYAMALFVLGFGEVLGNLTDARRDDEGLLMDEERLPKRVRIKKAPLAL